MKSLILFILPIAIIISSSLTKAATNDVYGSWSVSCGSQNCAMTQAVAKDKEGKQVMLGLSINFAFNSELGIMMVRLPKVVDQSAGLGIKVDENKSIRLPITQCTAAACQSLVKLDQIIIDEFSAGKVAKFAYALPNSKQVILPISLDQFAAAYAELRLKHSNSE